MTEANLELGDMTVVGRPPAKLMKALAVIADTLHPTFARWPRMEHPEKSKESCVLCSLTVRDFLASINIIAEVRAVRLLMVAQQNGRELHSLGVGLPGTPDKPGRWNGHLVVLVPSAGYLIDTTLYPMIRPQWQQLTGMMAVPIARRMVVHGEELSGISVADTERPGYEFEMAWYDAHENRRWRIGPDARPEMRRGTVAALRRRFGEWKESA